MEEFKCPCGYVFVLTKKSVYGPIFDATNGDKYVMYPLAAAKVRPRADFKEWWGDCHAQYKRQKANSAKDKESAPQR